MRFGSARRSLPQSQVRALMAIMTDGSLHSTAECFTLSVNQAAEFAV